MTTLAASPGAAVAGTKTLWKLDPSHSLVEFSVRHMMVSNVKGRFTGLTGQIETIDENISGAQVEVEIDPATIDTGNEQRDAHLKSPDFLDVETYPTIRFVSSRAVDHGNGTFDLIGDLTIRGVTKEINLKVEDNGRGNTPFGTYIAGFTASAELKRHDFGATWNVALETGGFVVGETVKISLELEAVKQLEK